MPLFSKLCYMSLSPCFYMVIDFTFHVFFKKLLKNLSFAVVSTVAWLAKPPPVALAPGRGSAHVSACGTGTPEWDQLMFQLFHLWFSYACLSPGKAADVPSAWSLHLCARPGRSWLWVWIGSALASHRPFGEWTHVWKIMHFLIHFLFNNFLTEKTEVLNVLVEILQVKKNNQRLLFLISNT